MILENVKKIHYWQAVELCGEGVPRNNFYFLDDSVSKVYVLVVAISYGGQLEHQLIGVDCKKEESDEKL